MNCAVCFQKNLIESHITAGNHSIIVNNLVLNNVRKGTRMYFGREEIFPAAAEEDTLLGRGRFTGDGAEGETRESDVAFDRVSPSGTAGSEGRHRARRAEDEDVVSVRSAAPTVSSAVNRVLRKLKDKVVETWHSLPGVVGEAWLGLTGGGHAVSPGNLAFDGPNSKVSLSQFQLDRTLGLLGLVVRKLSGARPVAGEEEPPSLLEVQGQVLSIVAEFEDLLEQLSREQLISSQESVFDQVNLQKRLVSMLVNGPNVDAGEILYNSLCRLLGAENYERKVFMMARIRSMFKAL